ncbi:MAG: response regulator transcription factor [Gloeobacteraceae cyanobacterium ES-bin-316]|nr:response regulator transcription factor [Ferruginibacter sp.]
MAIKLFIVDDHYMVIEGIHSLLQNEKEIEWTGHATNAGSCMAYLQNQVPDVILMDISLPDKSGIDLCREVKEKFPGIYILGLSTFNQQSFIEKMMNSGASGYVLKNATQEELIEGIRTVMTGRQYLSFDAATALRQAPTQSNVPLITRREKEVLGLIADGLTNTEIAKNLFISVATVDTHRKNLLAKFECKNIASLIRLAVNMQLV